MIVVTPRQMQEIDARAIKKYKVPGLTLMENAARALTEKAREMLAPDSPGAEQSVCLVCGPGNNGGDGLAAARLLKEQGCEVQVFLLGSTRYLKGDAGTNVKKLKAARIKITEIKGGQGLSVLMAVLKKSGLAVDAIFGTGFKGTADHRISGASKLAGQIIEAINSSGRPVLAADIPSGVNGKTGQALGPAVKAQATVTLGLLKTGLLFYPGRSLAGEISIADIGFPQKAIDEQKVNAGTIEAIEAKRMLPGRKPDAYKGSCGTMLVLAGSAGMTGAACLASLSALRSGAGLVYLGIPESLSDIMEAKLTEVITKPMPETRTKTLSLHALDRIKALMTKADSLLIGPGLSTYPETVELVQAVIKNIKIPAVLDADALNALSGNGQLLHSQAPLVLTPHYGEMARLSGWSIAEIKADPIRAASQFSVKYSLTIVLKGAPTVIAGSSGHLWINTTGNSGMATAGAGDVLAGLIAGLLAQGLSPERAAALGVYLHGLAGDLAAENKTEYCMLAGDILDHLPLAYKKLMEVS
ncbi:NAD(P)H-hydrate dehydratase [candidate division TA06 bacterium]|uniref:Bifunctional NAD(P)H-hydrate repair enzyme n=1 Tax=candidate division TA06 bacterium TaxID=2250710 RepID=A0A933ICN5_UNCT6|nr:NAD(P)H-hydrate dehydratase [candidate division TA06 bacterium]